MAKLKSYCERGSPDSAGKSRRSKVASKWSPGRVGKKSMWAFLRMEIQSKLVINPGRGVVAPTFPHTSEILVSRIPRSHACRDYAQILTQSSCAQAVEEARGSSGMPGWLSAAVTSLLSPEGVDHLIQWSHLHRTLWRFALTLKAVYWIISLIELCNFSWLWWSITFGSMK